MRIILTGGTGFIGGAVLKRALSDVNITSIIALSRRDLDVQDPKLQNIKHKDFLKYDKVVLDQLAGAEACIWCLGTPTGGREMRIDYPMAAANALSEATAPRLGTNKHFRFILLSGALTEKDQNKNLWFLGAARRLAGESENKMIAFEQQHPETWRSLVARPWSVITPKSVQAWVTPGGLSIEVDVLAAALVDAAVHGSEKRMLENEYLKARGKVLLVKA